MVIDVPECWRDAINESNAKLSYPTADNVAKELRDKIETFSQEYAKLADPVWKRDYEKAYEKTVNYIKDMRKKFEKYPNA
jgi:hypothetical protein